MTNFLADHTLLRIDVPFLDKSSAEYVSSVVSQSVPLSRKSLFVEIFFSQDPSSLYWKEAVAWLAFVYGTATLESLSGSGSNPLLDLRVLLPQLSGSKDLPSQAVSNAKLSTWLLVPGVNVAVDSVNAQRQALGYSPLQTFTLSCANLPVIASAPLPLTEVSSMDSCFDRYQHVVMGGTFDHLHSGHKVLLTAAVWLTTDTLVIGLTGEQLLVNKKLSSFLQPFAFRYSFLLDFLHSVRPSVHYRIECIQDPVGPAGVLPELQSVVLTEETIKGGDLINQQRLARGLGALEVVVAQLVHTPSAASSASSAAAASAAAHQAHIASKLSSTDLRQVLHDHAGNSNVDWLKSQWVKLCKDLQVRESFAVSAESVRERVGGSEFVFDQVQSFQTEDMSIKSSYATVFQQHSSAPATSSNSVSPQSLAPAAVSIPEWWWSVLRDNYLEGWRKYHSLEHIHHMLLQVKLLEGSQANSVEATNSPLRLETASWLSQVLTAGAEGGAEAGDGKAVALWRPELVELAVWFHDAVYVPQNKDNEEASALLFTQFAAEAGLSREDAQLVVQYIMATKTHALPPQFSAPSASAASDGSSGSASGSTSGSVSGCALAGAGPLNDVSLFLDIDLSILGSSPGLYAVYSQQIRQEYCHMAEAPFKEGRAHVLKKFLQRPQLYFSSLYRDRLEEQARNNLTLEIASLTPSTSSL